METHNNRWVLIAAAAVVLFAAGVFVGSGLARLLDGEPGRAAFFLILGAALVWVSSLRGPERPGA